MSIKERIELQILYMGLFPIFFCMRIFGLAYTLGVGDKNKAATMMYQTLSKQGKCNTEEDRDDNFTICAYLTGLISYTRLFCRVMNV